MYLFLFIYVNCIIYCLQNVKFLSKNNNNSISYAEHQWHYLRIVVPVQKF